MNPSPRLQRWAARLTLLVACTAGVATAPVMSPEVRSEHEAPPLRLTAADPTTTLHRRLEIFSEQPSSDHVVLALTAQVTARWTPADPTHTVKPRLRAWLAMAQDLQSGDKWVVLEEPNQPVEVIANAYSSECMLSSVCTWEVSLELQADSVEGAIDVDWKLVALASVDGIDEVPEGFTVRFLEP